MDQLTAYQLAEWEAYDKIDPIGTWRDDFRMAFLSSLVTNLTVQVHGKKGTKLMVPIDFMPEWDMERKTMVVKKQTMEEMKAFALNFAKEHNKQFKKKQIINDVPPKLRHNKYQGLC